ncbi:cyclic pyranopterin phosphate synthase [Armatimonas rosea]|uniref:Cyclic pyranopterin phosphate synthase n=2 Tax=Armatimonas rosea TaxID=685828 RepID=A0A7W9SXQ2_ARMRO|nr:cyclic pyranopterin phosphate synthase [Armatimonas rosea]
MPEEGVPYGDLDDVLTFEEIERVVRVLASAGLKKVRLTGGEPLVRKNTPELTARLAAIAGVHEVTLTTNGILLARDAQALWDAGIRRLNLSMDTLQPERFVKLARRAEFARAREGLETALACGFSPLKLNCVLMRGINDDEIEDFGRLTLERPLSVRFLEYMPIGQVSNAQWRAQYVPNDEVVARLRALWPNLEPLEDAPESTSRNFRIPGALGTVGVINPISHKFCEGCNRLRLTANGKLVPCLSDNFEYDLMGPLRTSCTDHELLEHVATALAHKPLQSDFEGRLVYGGSLRTMSQIGG